MYGQIKIENHTGINKRFGIIFPIGMYIEIYVNYDDVNHEQVDIEAIKIVQCLNDHLHKY